MIDIDRYLLRVKKPQRYINRELNLPNKEWDNAKVRMCFAFPDAYEIGMAYFGFQVLYELVNAREEYVGERTYAPWPDLEHVMRS